jgi:KaiC/GvpD/RAD55 family RecA-like ATPase
MFVDNKKLIELEKELKNLDKNAIVMVSTSSQEYFEVYLFILDLILNRFKAECICVTINRSSTNLLSILENRKIDTQNIYLIDCISKTAGIEKTTERCEYVSHPESLEEINLYVNSYVSSLMKDDRFLFFDSISTLLIYNDPKTILQFINFSVQRIRASNVRGIVMLTKKELDPNFVGQMIQFCDKFIEV